MKNTKIYSIKNFVIPILIYLKKNEHILIFQNVTKLFPMIILL